MLRFLLRRLGRGILTIFISVTLVFFIVRAMPSDPVALLISPQMTEETQQALMESYGLDKPLGTQYILYMKELLHGNLGTSFAKRIPVTEYLAQKLPWTLLLLAAVMVIVLVIGIPVGLLAASRRGKLADRIISIVVTLGISVFIPFMAFLLLYVFSFRLAIAPTGGAYTPPKGAGNFWNGAGFWIPIMRQSEWENVEDPTTYDYSGAGYGPYYISEWVDGEYVVLERNPYFTLANDGQGAYLDEVVFRVYTDENAMVLALQNGEIDVCANFLSTSSVTQLQSNPQYLISTVPSLGYAFISYSQTNELLQDVNVRLALSMCADRDALVNVAFAGGATAMYTPISPVYQDFVASNIQQPAFDPAGAAALLEENGYTDSDGDGIREAADGTPLSFTISYKSTLQNVDGVMSILQSGMKEAGIELVLQPVDAATFSANVTQGHTYDISYSSWGTIDDVDTTLLTLFGVDQTLNFMEYDDLVQEEMLLAMQGEPDYEKRVEMLNEWQTYFVENMPACHLLVPNNSYAADTTNFGGWSIVPGNSAYLNCAQFVSVYAK